MPKTPDRYLQTDPWRVIEEGFDRAHSRISESVFSLGNEFMGARGFFEEGYSGDTLEGCYFNGIYDAEILSQGGYKGVVLETEFMANAVNWLKVEIAAGGEKLDLAFSEFRDFRRTLDFQNGLMTRSFVWKLKNGAEAVVIFERLLSMGDASIGAQRITIKPLNHDLEILLTASSDFGEEHKMYRRNCWTDVVMSAEGDRIVGEGATLNRGKKLFTEAKCTLSVDAEKESFTEEKAAGFRYRAHIKAQQSAVFERIVRNSAENITEHVPENLHFAEILASNTEWWRNAFASADIRIDGDDENQQGIRFCIFQLFQTYHGVNENNNIGAKGLTGEAYNGNAFWDTETYCLPFFLYHSPKSAKNLLMYRYKTLPQARERARALDCRGAFYPIATISGTECCNLWQHASLQLQASTGVAYGIWAYVHATHDLAFLRDYGLEMLLEISRMLASRGDWSADHSEYGFFGVMGPDEFQMMVNHNCYTNYMGKFTLNFALESLRKIDEEYPEAGRAVREKVGLSEDETADWREIRDHMKILYDPETGLFEQQEGFFRLPHIDIDAIPDSDFPLYAHWTYDRIYRNDMIKQPDVLMMMLLRNGEFTEDQLRANYEYYEPRCLHESSLSPSVHSILATQLGKQKEAFEFFRFATRMDLDNWNRNSGEGIHTTSIAAAWMNIVYGFGGFRSDGERPSFRPWLPEQWKGYSFRLTLEKKTVEIEASGDEVRLRFAEGTDPSAELPLTIYGRDEVLTAEGIRVKLQK